MKRTMEARCPNCRSNHVGRIGRTGVFNAPHTGATPSMEVWFCDACESSLIKVPR